MPIIKRNKQPIINQIKNICSYISIYYIISPFSHILQLNSIFDYILLIFVTRFDTCIKDISYLCIRVQITEAQWVEERKQK